LIIRRSKRRGQGVETTDLRNKRKKGLTCGKTIVGYRNCLAHIQPTLGNKELQELTAADIRNWLSTLRQAGRISART